MRRSPGLLSACLALSLGLLGCSSITPAAEPNIPRGQCIMSGIDRHDDPAIATQAQAVLQANGVPFTAVVGADRGEASVCNRGGNEVTAFATMDHIVGVTIPVATLSNNEVMGAYVKQIVTMLQLSAGSAGPFNLHEVSVHFVVGADARLVRTSVETAQAAEKQGLSGAAYLAVVEVP